MGFLPEAWQAWLEQQGERSYRASQVFRWIYRRGVFDPTQMTDLPSPLRQRLTDLGLREPGQVLQVHRSTDGTRKLVIRLEDDARVECVLIPMSDDLDAGSVDADVAAAEEAEAIDPSAGDPPRGRVTLCVSTQYGCKFGCAFCASGQGGFRRDLEADEIVYQQIVASRHLDPDERLQNIVFMGMGEPLDCYERTAAAIRLLTHDDGPRMSPRRITVSTAGLVPGIRRLGTDFSGKVGLAVSLHAADDDLRSRLMPLNRRYPIRDLMAALHEYPLPRRRRITIEYTLIDGVNDSLGQARALGRLLAGLRVKINLISLNPVAGLSLGASPPDRVAAFREELAGAGYSCFVRTRRGDEVAAACGQLAMGGGCRSD